MFVNTGDYIEQVADSAVRSTYYTFTPRPLMEGSFYTMNDDLALLLAETHRALGILEGMAYFSHDRKDLANLILLRESAFSRMIDYHGKDIYSVLVGRASGNDSDDVQKIITAYDYAMDTTTNKLNFDAIINRALHGGEQKRKAATRVKPLFMMQSTANYRQYNPTAPRDILPALTDIRKYIESSNADILIKAALCHYQFEMIHPYEYYNGIVGRILPYHMLCISEMIGARFCSFSASLYRHKAEYFDKLESTQKNGNYTKWIDFYIRIICDTAQRGAEFIRFYEKTTRHDEEIISNQLHGRADHSVAVYRHFKTNVISSIGFASNQLKLAFDTVSRSVGILQNMGVLTQTTPGSRNRLFAHERIMQRLVSPE